MPVLPHSAVTDFGLLSQRAFMEPLLCAEVEETGGPSPGSRGRQGGRWPRIGRTQPGEEPRQVHGRALGAIRWGQYLWEVSVTTGRASNAPGPCSQAVRPGFSGLYFCGDTRERAGLGFQWG